MDQSALGSRAIRGMYAAAMEAPRAGWRDAAANLFTSDQDSETYKWLGFAPAMREWIGGRQAKGFRDNGISIANKHFESTIEIKVKDARRDKTRQIRTRVSEHVQRADTHWDGLLTTLILNGATTVCYDGQYFFDTDHTEGENTTSQSNSITADISTAPGAGSDNTVSSPNAAQAQWSVMKGLAAMGAFRDDRNEPMNEGMSSFLVMTPPNLYLPILSALAPAATMAMQQNINPNVVTPWRVDVAQNARLDSWTDKFVIFRTDSATKALIRQEEAPVSLKEKAEGSEYEFDNDAWQFGLDAWRNVGYGLWQRAVLVTMT